MKRATSPSSALQGRKSPGRYGALILLMTSILIVDGRETIIIDDFESGNLAAWSLYVRGAGSGLSMTTVRPHPNRHKAVVPIHLAYQTLRKANMLL
jgi:hypothetical protein